VAARADPDNDTYWSVYRISKKALTGVVRVVHPSRPWAFAAVQSSITSLSF
jgi:hypothetical protein